MSNITLIIVIVVAVAIIVALVVAGAQMARRKRTEQLRQQYGPEYDRAIDEADSQRAAESELGATAQEEGRRARSCAPSTRLNGRTLTGVGQTSRPSSWTTRVPPYAMLGSRWWR